MDDKTIMIAGMSDRIVEQTRHISDLKQRERLLSSGPSRSGAENEKLKEDLRLAEAAARSATIQRDEAWKALAMKEELLKEWMHSNEAFKRLARKYGKKVGVSDEQRQNDLDDQIIEVAEEKPEFANTNTLKASKEARGIK